MCKEEKEKEKRQLTVKKRHTQRTSKPERGKKSLDLT